MQNVKCKRQNGRSILSLLLSAFTFLFCFYATAEDPPKTAPPAAAGWESLFDGRTLGKWKAIQFGGEGAVSVEDGAIVMAAGNDMTGVTWTGKLPQIDYELTLEGKRIDGDDFFCTTTFPVADRFCSLVVGGWSGRVVGLSNVDGYDASENHTTRLMTFKRNQWYRVRIRVTNAKIEAWIGDEKLVDQAVSGHKVSIRMECDPCRPLGIATWETKGAVRNIRLRRLPAKEAAPPSPAAQNSPKPIHWKKADENLIRVGLLTADAVQKDLGLTAEQRRKIKEFAKISGARWREFLAKVPNSSLSGVPFQMSEAKLRELRAWLQEWQSTQKEWRAKIVAMLTPSQSERLKQIQLQYAIAAALAQPELIKALDISEAQLAKIRPLSDSDRIAEKRLAELHGLDGLPPKERRKKSIELSKGWDKAQAEANKLALGVLTPEQRAKLERFVGKQIDTTWDYEALVPDDE